MNATSRFSTLALGSLALICGANSRATLVDYKVAVTNEPAIISYYTFDASNVTDSRGLHNGTTAGGATFGIGITADSKALILDGTGRANLGTVTDFDFTDGTGSVEAWLRVGWGGTSPGYNPCVFADRTGGVRWSVHMNGDKSGVGVWNGSSYLWVPIPPPGTNWHHLVVVFNPTYIEYFWDGQPLEIRSQDLFGAGSSTQLGSSSGTRTDEGWIGGYDEVAFYSDVLSAAQVQAHYAAFFAGTPPVITSQPRGGNYLPGVALRVAVGASGPNLTYQWYKNGGQLSGKTDATLNFPSLVTDDAGTYRVVVHNPAADVTSSNAVIVVTPTLPTPLVQYQSAALAQPSILACYSFDHLSADSSIGTYHGYLAGTADFGTGVDGGPGQGLLLDGGGFVGLGTVDAYNFLDNTGTIEAWIRADWPASSLLYNPCLFADRDGGQVTWSVHMNADKRGLGVWNGSTYQPVGLPDARTDWHHLAVVFDTGTNTIYWDGLPIGTAEQAFGLGNSSTQLGSSQALSPAESWIGLLDEVAFYADALPASTIQAHYKTFVGAGRPSITVQPVGGAFYTGQYFEMNVGATGADRTYQWFKDTVSIPSQTNYNLVFTSLAPSDSGTYFVVVSNASGSTNSVSVQLQVGNNLAQYQSAVSNETSLISYYTFDAGDATDRQSTNNGALANSAQFSQGVGLGADQALLLNGSGHINLGQVPDFEFINGVGTAEAWIRADWTSDPFYDPCVFSDRVATIGQVDWSIHMGRFQNIIGNWNGAFFQSVGLPAFSGWHHYAVTFGGDRVAMYWDGQLLGSFAQPIAIGTGLSAQIGSSDPGTTTEGWIGGIDEVAFYRATLSQETIYSHFLAMVSQAPATGPKLGILGSPGHVTISWPPEVTGFTLEYATSLPATSWLPVDGVANNSVTVEATGTRFYRLKK